MPNAAQPQPKRVIRVVPYHLKNFLAVLCRIFPIRDYASTPTFANPQSVYAREARLSNQYNRRRDVRIQEGIFLPKTETRSCVGPVEPPGLGQSYRESLRSRANACFTVNDGFFHVARQTSALRSSLNAPLFDHHRLEQRLLRCAKLWSQSGQSGACLDIACKSFCLFADAQNQLACV